MENGKIKCLTCRHGCLLEEGLEGICKTRKVVNGKLVSFNEGNISSLSLNPIEKKPFYHFFPGTFALTIGSWSCNFACPWCQNYDITKVRPRTSGKILIIKPEALVEEILHTRECSGISFSFNEPTLNVDYALEVLKLLSRKNPKLYSNFVTNGYMSREVLDELIKAKLSAMVVSLKGNKVSMNRYCKANIDYIFENIKSALEKKIHIEIVILVITTVNDSQEYFQGISEKIVKDFGENIPVHLNAYYPAYKFNEPPTSPVILEKARAIAMNKGLKFVYIGNLSSHFALHTYCPSCGNIVIKRSLSRFLESKIIENNRCPYCLEKIQIVNTLNNP